MTDDFLFKEIDVHLAASLSRRFRLVRQLGQGGMGAVYLAEQIAVGNRPVALKVLSRKLLDDPDFLLRFQNEAASTGRIHHPNVVTIYESSQADDGTPYIAMEFLEGESLRQTLARRGALPVHEVAEILQQTARGLNAAHKLGIIHRDLKPDNIFLTYPDDDSVARVACPDLSGSPPANARDVGAGLVPLLPVGTADRGRAQDPPLRPVVVKLVDFGIAKLRESATHTQTGMVLGTPAYMSFEQASGMRSDELDARSDVYSLGVVVYEMLTGRTPFHSDTPVGYLRMHMMDEPPSFRAVAPGLGIPPAVEGAVMRALAKDRDQRYAYALDFARALASAAQPSPRAEAPPTISSTPIAPPPARRRAARKPAAPVPLPATVQAKADIADQTTPPVLPGIIVEPPSARPQGSELVTAANRQPALAEPPHHPVVKKSSSGVKIAVLGLGLLAVIAVGIWYFSLSRPEPPPNVTSQSPATTVPAGQEARPETPLANPKPAPRVAKVNPKDGLKYAWIPPGNFQMGCSQGDTECQDNEKPPHQVTITKGFWLGQTKVTAGAYERFAVATGRHMPITPHFEGRGIETAWGDEAMPIANEVWDDDQAYCRWVGGRLPTEAEWEYAARAGNTAARYGDLDEISWYADNSGRQRLDSDKYWKEGEDNYNKRLKENGNGTHEVGRKLANGFGLFDMLGNVWEWVNDWVRPGLLPGWPLPRPYGGDETDVILVTRSCRARRVLVRPSPSRPRFGSRRNRLN